MALIRNVMFPDGTILRRHEVDNILHIANGSTHIEVVSFKGDEDDDGRHTPLAFDLDDTVGFEAAYGLVANHPRFAEYEDPVQAALDEVLDILTDEQAEQVPDAFPLWQAGKAYAVGARVRYGSDLYKCLIAHTSQEGQTPDVAVSLWARMLNPDPEVIPVWVQPDSTNSYMKGDKVHYPTADGPIYISIQDYNVFAPDVAGWELWEEG